MGSVFFLVSLRAPSEMVCSRLGTSTAGPSTHRERPEPKYGNRMARRAVYWDFNTARRRVGNTIFWEVSLERPTNLPAACVLAAARYWRKWLRCGGPAP